MKAVIQAGGKGTRISSITGDVIPKPMLEVEGFPILYHQIMNLKKNGINDITIITGHLGSVIEEYFKDGKDLGVNISYYREDDENPLGTAGALYYLKDSLNDDFIFLLADIFIDIDFKKMKKYHKDHNAEITLFTHPNSHPYDSDLIVIDNRSNKVLEFDSKNNNRSQYDYNNLINAGIMIFSKDVLELIQEPKKYNYEKDIVIPLIKTGKVYSYKSTEYAKDMGTPERYLKVQEDYRLGLCNKKNLSNKQKCIFLDRDGTINEYVGLLKNKKDLKLIANVSEAIKLINDSEYLCIVITNQPIIARGDSTVENLYDIHKRMETLLGKNGAYIDDLYYCPHHPDKGYEGELAELKIDCNCRKPKIGMVLKATLEHNIDVENSIMIGDTTLDIKLAKNAGMKSVLLKTGQAGNDKKFDATPDYIEEDLFSSINKLIERN